MPKCTNGHETPLELECPSCGAVVDYPRAIEELVHTPKINPSIEDVSVLSVGMPLPSVPRVFAGEATVGDLDEEDVGRIMLRKLEGGTWLDYDRTYSKKLQRWLKLMLFHRSRYKVLVVDTVNPLSVLALRALPTGENTLVLAITADTVSPPIERYTSYVALTIALQRRARLIVASNGYVEELGHFVEGEGLSVGRQSLGQIVSFLLTSIGDLMDFVERDDRLGVRFHCFSATMAASNLVYRSPNDALLVQKGQTSMELQPHEAVAAYLLASGTGEVREDLTQGFKEYCSQELGNLMSAENRFYVKPSRYSLYDLFILYGLKDAQPPAALRKGYETIVSRAPDLRVEDLR